MIAPPPPAFVDARVVLDTSVLFGAFPRYLLLSLAVAGVYDALWSVQILAELERVLVRERVAPAAAAHQRRKLEADFPDALPSASLPTRPAGAVLPDPNDWHVMATALAHARPAGTPLAGTPLILTHNSRHFSQRVLAQSALAPFGLRAESPDRWLFRLYTDAAAGGAAPDVHAALEAHRLSLTAPNGSGGRRPWTEPEYRGRMRAEGLATLEALLPTGVI